MSPELLLECNHVALIIGKIFCDIFVCALAEVFPEEREAITKSI